MLDLKNSKDLEKLKALVSQSDVLVENFVPGKMEEMGLRVDVLHSLNPRLVIARVSGWGKQVHLCLQTRIRDSGGSHVRIRPSQWIS